MKRRCTTSSVFFYLDTNDARQRAVLCLQGIRQILNLRLKGFTSQISIQFALVVD